MADGYNVSVDFKEVMDKLKQLDDRTRTAVRVIGDTVGQEMKSHAQTNGAWTDRTSDARQGLSYNVDMKEQSLDIAVYHTVDYGLWLEKKESFAGKYKVLEDARDSQVETFKRMMKELLR